MRFLQIALGNREEAFVINHFSDGINVISSDDNNKGKTIVIQSMLYALGNEPAFPSTFEYQNYYHIVRFEVKEQEYIICRKLNSFVLKSNGTLMIFNNLSELKRFWDKHIFHLPRITKDGLVRIVDPVLFFQLFFVGQDKKDTSNIVHRGYYTKDDFANMLFSYMEVGTRVVDENGLQIAKTRLSEVKDEIVRLRRRFKILKSSKLSTTYLSPSSDRYALEMKIKEVETLTEKITTLRKHRNNCIGRKKKYEMSKKELTSLNRSIVGGELRCLDCNSAHIGFSTGSEETCSFDISTPEIRTQILHSISDKIDSYDEEIRRTTQEINSCQEQLTRVLSESEITLEMIYMLKQDVIDSAEAESRIAELERESSALSSLLKTNETSTTAQLEKQKVLIQQLLNFMNDTYKRIDPYGNLFFEGLFSKKDQVYSGSEATLYHLVKVYSLAKITSHPFPIIIDSFRTEDLSSDKEDIILDLYSELDNQIFFTTTLKREELGKYDCETRVHHIDFSVNQPSKLLSAKNVSEFSEIIKELSIEI